MTPVSPVDRLINIIDILKTEKSASIEALSKKFNVSQETIRRDVKQLESKQLATKVHGGVRLMQDSLLEPPYRKRLHQNIESKRAIAKKAAELVKNGMTIFIDCGTTSYWLAQALTSIHSLFIITNSLEVAHSLLGKNDWRIVFTGGQLDNEYRATLGHESIAQASRFLPDITFFSIGAIDSQNGFLDFSIDEADFKRSLLNNVRKSVVLADASKFIQPGAVHLANFTDIDVLVCDQAPPPILDKALRAANIEILVAQENPTSNN